MYFHYFSIISQLERVWPFIWTHLNPLYPKCCVPVLVKIDPDVLETNFFIRIFIISLLSPFENGGDSSFSKRSSVLVFVFINLSQMLWRRRFILSVFNVFSLFRCYLALEKSISLYINNVEFTCTQNALCQVVLNLAQWFRRRGQNVRIKTTTTTTDTKKLSISKAPLRLQLPS